MCWQQLTWRLGHFGRNGTVVEPKWELVKTPSDQCNCTAHSTVPSTVGFTWNV